MSADPVVAGGPLDAARIKAIRDRAGLLRNTFHADPKATCTCSDDDPRGHCRKHGETPAIAHHKATDDDCERWVLHLGCDCEGCYLLCTVVGGGHEAPGEAEALAIAHIGRDALDLLDELRDLRDRERSHLEFQRQLAKVLGFDELGGHEELLASAIELVSLPPGC